jgi:hypothetical protein
MEKQGQAEKADATVAKLSVDEPDVETEKVQDEKTEPAEH